MVVFVMNAESLQRQALSVWEQLPKLAFSRQGVAQAIFLMRDESEGGGKRHTWERLTNNERSVVGEGNEGECAAHLGSELKK